MNLLLFHFFNDLAGHSWWVDSVISLVLANDLIKSAIIGGCFFGAWYSGTTPSQTLTARRRLLITLLSALLTVATTTLISKLVLQPRPCLQAHKIYQLKGNELQEMPKLSFRQPLDNRSKEHERAYSLGNLPPNDLGSFPSDHAGFFLCLSLGIWTVSRSFGSIALTWTFLVILLSKLVMGMHTPLEVAVGCLIATIWLYSCSYLSQIFFDRPFSKVATLTIRYPSLTAAGLFIALFEVASSLDHVKTILAAIGKHV